MADRKFSFSMRIRVGIGATTINVGSVGPHGHHKAVFLLAGGIVVAQIDAQRVFGRICESSELLASSSACK